MYSVVMLVAMGTAPEVPDFGGLFRRGCNGCGGCYGACYGGCYGGCRGGCWGGCWSGCYGGCHGGCWGGCWGGCYGGGHGGCYGGWGAYYGGCYGCYGYGMPQAVPGTYSTPMVPSGPEQAAPPGKDATYAPAGADRAAVTIRLPADAKLYANGQPTVLTSAERRFVTPPLRPGRDYQYTFRAEYVRDGRTVTEEKVVRVRPGEGTQVEFGGAARAVASAPAEAARSQVTVKLPADAELYVDGVRSRLTSAERVFQTPPLEPGKPYTYRFRAEVVRNGERQVREQEVVFRGGEPVTVDFTDMATTPVAAER